MSYEIIFTTKAEKQFKKLDKITQTRIGYALERITTRPDEYVRKLSGFSYYRLRVGDYRIIMDIQHQSLIIFIIAVAHRRNVYESFG